MAKYRVAIVGCGARSGAHIEAYRQITQAKVVACADTDTDRREKIAAEFGLHPYGDPAEMIRSESPDVVHLVTWPTERVELMTMVSDLDTPACIVEKPIAAGVADWQAMCRLRAVTKTKFAVCHQCRWSPNFARCLKAVRSGKLGEVKLLDFSAGFNISGQGTHILNYGMALNGDRPVVGVFGAASGNSEMHTGHPAPDATVGYITFENGVRGSWTNGPAAPRGGGEQAAEQCQIADRERAFQLLPPDLAGAPGLVRKAHRRHVLALDPLEFPERLGAGAAVADRAKLLVRQHAAMHPHIGLQRPVGARD